MKSAHQPLPLAVRGRLSTQIPSDSRSLDSTLTTFRINTCKSVSKQTTLTTFRMNTYEKPGEGGTPANRWFRISGSARHMRHVTPLSPAPSLDCAYFPSPRGCDCLCDLCAPVSVASVL